MFRRDILSWWLRPSFLRDGGEKKKVLFAGPWLGEFGWELMNWQAFLRWLAPYYEEVIVCCRPGMESLYEDFSSRFILHEIRGTANCNRALSMENPEALEEILAGVPAYADHLFDVGWQPDKRKRFIHFGKDVFPNAPELLFHPRGRFHGADRNWSANKWQELLKRFEQAGIRTGCIGLSSATAKIEGAFEDFRDRPLAETMDLIASSKLVIGPSSGPMHLASLCGTPHLVWTDHKRYARGRTNRVKYEHWWNPHGTMVQVLEEGGFDPSVDEVERLAKEMIS